MIAESYIHYTVDQKIATIEFFTPLHNSLPSSILQQLAETIIRAASDDAVTVIILKSGGNKTFCAGASFDELLSIDSEDEGERFFSGFVHVINAMRKTNKFIIGRIQGKAIGGGVGIAAACDYTLATTTAEIKLSELAIGIGPFVIGPVIERKIGRTFTYQMSIDAASFKTAAWAKDKGLYASVYDDIQALDEATHQLATTLSNYSPEAMAEIKKAYWAGTEHWDTLLYEKAAISGRLVLTNFTRNALLTFKNK